MFTHVWSQKGVGRFTILDVENVQPLDQGSNFFVGPEHVGLPRAKARIDEGFHVCVVCFMGLWSGV